MIRDFLIEAKKQTYANETIEKAIWKMIKVHRDYRYIENT